MAKLIFCYQFESVDDVNEFVSKLYLYYIARKHKLPKLEGRLEDLQVVVEGFEDSQERQRQLIAMEYLAGYFHGKPKLDEPVLEKKRMH